MICLVFNISTIRNVVYTMDNAPYRLVGMSLLDQRAQYARGARY